MRPLIIALLFALVTIPISAIGDTEESAQVIEEIVVTAQRREQSLQDVPIAITAITGEDLEANGMVDQEEALRQVPGTVYTQAISSVAAVMNIRGLVGLSGNDPTTGYYIDDYAYGSPALGLAPPSDLYDLERVEVLRGPQGTLWGAGAMGGLVRFITADPDASSGFYGKAQLSAGSITDGGDHYVGNIALNIPLVEDKFAARVVASYRDYGGYIDHPTGKDANEHEAESYRIKFKYESDKWTAKLGFSHVEYDDPFGRTLDAPVENRASGGVVSKFAAEQDVVHFSFNYDIGSFRLENSTAWGDWEEQQVFENPFFFAATPFEVDTFSQEIRLISQNDDQFQWIAGVFYRTADLKFPLEFNVTGVFDSLDQTFTDTEELAYFGEVSYALDDGRWVLLAGIRVSEEDRDFLSDVEQTGFLLGIPDIDTMELRSESFDTTNPRVNVSFFPNENTTLYFNAAKGYRPGRVNFTGPVSIAGLFGVTGIETIEDDSVWTYEIGAKATLFDGSLHLEAAAYYSDWQDTQWGVALPNGFAVIYNVGDAEIRGADLAVKWQTPVDGLTVSLTAAYTKGEWDSIKNPATSTLDPLVASGEELTEVPKVTGYLNLDYSRPLWENINLIASANYYYRDELSESAVLVADSMSILGLNVGLQAESWDAVVYAKNVTDYDEATVFSGAFPVSENPREVGLRLSFHF